MIQDAKYIANATVIKVYHVDISSGAIQGITANGRAFSFKIVNGDLPECGDLILVGATDWDYASEALWQQINSVGIVRDLLGKDQVLLEEGYSATLAPRGNIEDLAVGNTVEFNAMDGPVRVLSKEPIRIRDTLTQEEDVQAVYRVARGDRPLSFDDFGGYPDVIARARQLIETQFETRELLNEIGAQPVKGILFTGPPGTGKTYLAKIIAYVSQAEFYLVSGPSIVSKWVGDTENTLRRIFESARQGNAERAIVFFDEIDSIAERRSGDSHEASRRLVAQLLTLMDGFANEDKSIVVIAATNRAESLDPALLRPGRFDWEIEFTPPTLQDRIEILEVGSRTVKTTDDLPIEDLASLTGGWSAADLKLLWTEAALLAADDGRGRIASEDLVQAYERVLLRPRRSSHPAKETVA